MKDLSITFVTAGCRPDNYGTDAAHRQFSVHNAMEVVMPRGDKSKYTDKQERKADHIAESYESRGVPEGEAERRAWATVNKESGGGKKSGSGRGKPESHASSRKGGKLGGRASASRSAAERSASAKKAAATRKRNAEQRSAAR
jgi:plasmid stabilization system protein ParE